MLEKKKIIIVNNNLNIGGVQKSLINLLKEIAEKVDVTLFLFSDTGKYIEDIPGNVKIIKCTTLYKYFGISQKECKNFIERISRGFLATLAKTFGRSVVLRLISLTQPTLKEHYDCAISFLHNGGEKSFYGGCNEFVLKKINADTKIAFLHCDYTSCGANNRINNKKYKKFDIVAACSDGCRNSFLKCVDISPQKVFTVKNCHDFSTIDSLSNVDTIQYSNEVINIISVARLSIEKGIERGIQAVYAACKKGANINYHIVGDGIKKSELVKLCTELNISDKVIFYGDQKNPYRYMKNADLLLIPSYHEAAPMVIDEARFLGVPILSTETTSSIDMIISTNSGWVCSNDQNGLDQTLYEIIFDKNSLQNKKNEMKGRIINNDIALDNFYFVIGGNNEQ